MSATQGLGTGDLLDRIVERAARRARARREEATRAGGDRAARTSASRRCVNRLLGEERVIVTPSRRAPRATRSTPAIEVDGRAGGAGRHRRAAPAHQGGRHGRLLRPAALRAGGRARRRGDRGLRRRRGRHQRGPARSPRWRCRRSARPWSRSTSGTSRAPTSRTPRRASRRSCASARRCWRCRRRPGRGLQAAGGRGARRWPTARRERIPTPELNRFLADLQAARQPPAGARQAAAACYYMAQFETRPPRFAVQVNDRAPGHARLRLLPREPAARALRPQGVPLVIDFKTQPRALRADGAPLARSRSVPFPAPMTTQPLSDNEFLFTSESVTEGHPGQDGRPDLRRRPRRRDGGGPGPAASPARRS